jgi:hypothetical protein
MPRVESTNFNLNIQVLVQATHIVSSTVPYLLSVANSLLFG